MTTARKISYATRTLTIPAGGSQQVYRDSEFLSVLSASFAFNMAFDDAPVFEGDAGITYTPVNGFARVRIENPSATAPLTVQLGFGHGNVRDGRVTINSGQILPVRDAAPDVVTSGNSAIAAGANINLVPQANQREVVIQNDSRNGSNIIVRGSAAGSGLSLADGQSMTLQTSGAVNLFASSAATVRWLATSWSA